MSIKKDEVVDLRNKGLTFTEIGIIFKVSRQRVHQIFTGYFKTYQKSDSYLEYRRHYNGHINPYKSCRYCEEESVNSIDKTRDKMYIDR